MEFCSNLLKLASCELNGEMWVERFSFWIGSRFAELKIRVLQIQIISIIPWKMESDIWGASHSSHIYPNSKGGLPTSPLPDQVGWALEKHRMCSTKSVYRAI